MNRQLGPIKAFICFAKSIRPNKPEILGKTPWDWFVFVILPCGALILILFEIDGNRKTTLREIEASRKALQESFEFQTQFNQQQALQSYLIQMSLMLSEQDLINQLPESSSARAASGLTISTLGLVGPSEKRSVFDFLYASELIKRNSPIVSLSGSDLSDLDLSSSTFRISSPNKTTNFPEKANGSISLAGVDLSRAKLMEIDLINSNLKASKLSEADLKRSDLSGSNMEQAKLNNADLTESILSGADLEGSTFSDANLDYANFEFTNLTRAYLDTENLTGTNFRLANLTEANLISAVFKEANLRRANLRNAIFISSGDFFYGFKSASFNMSNLSHVYFGAADLTKVNFGESDLSWSNLEGAILSNANLENVDLSHANLKRVDFSNANLAKVDFSNATLEGAELKGSNLWKTDFTQIKASNVGLFDSAVLCNTRVPDHSGLSPNRNCSSWLLIVLGQELKELRDIRYLMFILFSLGIIKIMKKHVSFKKASSNQKK